MIKPAPVLPTHVTADSCNGVTDAGEELNIKQGSDPVFLLVLIFLPPQTYVKKCLLRRNTHVVCHTRGGDVLGACG